MALVLASKVSNMEIPSRGSFLELRKWPGTVVRNTMWLRLLRNFVIEIPKTWVISRGYISDRKFLLAEVNSLKWSIRTFLRNTKLRKVSGGNASLTCGVVMKKTLKQRKELILWLLILVRERNMLNVRIATHHGIELKMRMDANPVSQSSISLT